MNAKPCEFVLAGGFTEPDRRNGESIGVSVDSVVWGGHFREDEDDELGIVLAGLNRESENE